MTHPVVKLGLGAIALVGFSLPAASAMAADLKSPVHTSFEVNSSSDSLIRAGATAYKKGHYAKSITYSRAALKNSISSRRAAIAQSNLCAAYANIGDLDNANTACETALDLRPDYTPAQTNISALKIQLAQK